MVDKLFVKKSSGGAVTRARLETTAIENKTVSNCTISQRITQTNY